VAAAAGVSPCPHQPHDHDHGHMTSIEIQQQVFIRGHYLLVDELYIDAMLNILERINSFNNVEAQQFIHNITS
jgi:hypothetical protein